MPLYQFWCDNCFEPIEVLMSIKRLDEFDNGEPLQCPECGQPLRKLIAPPKLVRIH